MRHRSLAGQWAESIVCRERTNEPLAILSIVMITGRSAQWQVPDVYAGSARLYSLAFALCLFYAAANRLDAAASAFGHFEGGRGKCGCISRSAICHFMLHEVPRQLA